jgi:hypothetical protein
MGECGREYVRRRPESSVLYEAVRAGFRELSAQKAVPRRIREEVERYLGCGDLRRGFAHVRCGRCRESMVVAFSCKGRGLCPSCAARRAEDAAAHGSEVLPAVPYRQWTLSLPRALRWAVVRQPKLLKVVARRLVQAVWRFQRSAARRLGARGGVRLQGGAVAQSQWFGSALQVTPHLHVLIPDGLWRQSEFMSLPPPEPVEVEGVLRRILRQLAKDFAGVEAGWAEDDWERVQAEGIQARLGLEREEVELAQGRRGRRLATLEGFSLHADTWVSGGDRAGLERLLRYAARGPMAGSKLTKEEDGRYRYESKKGRVVRLTAGELVRRLLAVVPPARMHLTVFHGVFAPNARGRGEVMGERGVEVTRVLRPPGGEGKEEKARRPRLDWGTLQRRTFGVDVWRCQCGGRREVLAVISNRRTAEEVLGRLGLLRGEAERAQGPPRRGEGQLRLALSAA